MLVSTCSASSNSIMVANFLKPDFLWCTKRGGGGEMALPSVFLIMLIKRGTMDMRDGTSRGKRRMGNAAEKYLYMKFSSFSVKVTINKCYTLFFKEDKGFSVFVRI